MNYEYCTALNHRATVLKEVDIDLSPTAEERYISMFGFDNSIYEHVKLTKTVSGFKGNYFCKFLYFDIDNDTDQQKSLDMARNLCLLLYNMLNVHPNDLFISFSGGKGFHVGLHQNLFGGLGIRKDMADRINVLAVRVLMECFEVTMDHIEEVAAESYKRCSKRIFNEMDLSIYNPNRIFRLMNSKNHKGGLYKIGLTYNELNTLTLDEIRELAKQPRPFRLTFNPSALMPNEDLCGLWKYALDFDFNDYKNKNIAQGKSAAFGGFYAPSQGSRNNDLFKQAAMLFDRSTLSEEHIVQLLDLINRSAQPPLPFSEVEQIVRSAFKKTLPNRAAKQQEIKSEAGAENFQDWFSEWADYYTTEPTPTTCLFDEINADQEFNFQGRVGAFIGKGGTRKSYGALNVVSQNIISYDARAIYSSMEMGKVEMINRTLDVSFPPENGMAPSVFYRSWVKEDKEGLKQRMKEAAKRLSDGLVLSNVSKMTAERYYQDLQRTKELYGPVQILAIDGLSMMGGKGSENERFEQHTAELKDLANQENLFIILICHTTKDAKPYMRDVSEYVRGSGKILDNCDFFLSFSNLIDPGRSTAENIEYYKNFGHIKYYNKRGTGLTLNKVYNFCGLTKEMTKSNASPMDFMEYEAFLKHIKKGKTSSPSGFPQV
ncbi:primase C-terminal domain-containing protein [Pontibacter pamirensis]|uniref:primase C-terminal domain-containing protein n=1 Tax=Pontibacter pamirensis TaxID=2562824 RepID=UPI0013896C3B|nr:primase C-terminal domain-containing protein [Pontibacter pamirensis]